MKYLFDQTNIKNNIIYFPLWRIQYTKFRPWTWEERYDILTTYADKKVWTHDCCVLGAILLEPDCNFCPTCGANRLNEPSDEAIHEYMEFAYD